MSAELTPGQRRILAFEGEIVGPRPGWNVDVEADYSSRGDPILCSGEEFADLFRRGFLEASELPLPHEVSRDAEGCEVTLSHRWVVTPAGRAAVQGFDPWPWPEKK